MGCPRKEPGVVFLPPERNGREIRGIGFEQDAVFRVAESKITDIVRLLERHHAAASEVRAERVETLEIGDASGE